jgi:tetratricopeptide (TPR) repeat protein
MKLYEKPAAGWFVLCGFLLGIIIITRPNFLLFVPFAVGWLFCYNKLKDKRKKYFYIGIFLLCTILPISLVTLRNYIKGNDFVLISSNGGINLYIGNNPTATGNTIALPPEIPLFRNAFMYPEIVKYVAGVEGKELKHSEVSSYFTRRALTYMKNNPSRTIALALKKAVMFVGGVEIPSERDLVAGRKKSWVLKILPLNFALLFALCLLGMVVYFTTIGNLKRKKRDDTLPVPGKSTFHFVVLILFLVGVYYLSYLPFFITSRFRMCIIPFLILFSGYAICHIYNRIALKQFSKAAVLSAAVILVYLIGNVNYFGFQRDMAKAEYDRGLAFARAKNYEAAIQSYGRAIRRRPNYADAYNNLGNMLREVGKNLQAVRNYEKALEYEPGHYFANLNLAQIHYTLNRLDKASDYYAKALAIRPTEYIYNILSNTYFKNDKVDKAIAVLKDAMKTYGRKANFLNNLGILYVFGKDFEKAEQTFSEVLRQNANDVQALLNMGRLYSSRGRLEEAKKYFELVLKSDPENKTAQELLKKLQSS